MVFFNSDEKEMMAKNQINLKEKSRSFSDTSLACRGDYDDNCSSSIALLSGSLVETECSVSISSSCELGKSLLKDGENVSTLPLSSFSPFTSLRLNYLMVTLVVMLADGLQGG
jgi:hypothetical protein